MGMMQFATGFLHLAPKDFWRMTLHEYLAAQKGWMQANGHEIEDNEPELTLDWYADLKAKVDKKKVN